MESKTQPSFEQLTQIVEQRMARIDTATACLNALDHQLPLHQKALMYVNQQAQQQARDVVEVDTTALMQQARLLAQTDSESQPEYFQVLFYKYILMLPTCPYQAIVADHEVFKQRKLPNLRQLNLWMQGQT